MASALVALLKDVECQIVRLDQRQAAPVLLGKSVTISGLIGDVSIPETWVKALTEVDIVFHFAAQTSVYVANEDPVNDLNRNILPMIYLLERCRKLKKRPVVLFSGTATETGMPSYLPVDEKHPDKPITVYDLHKLIAENYLKYYAGQGIVRGAVLRIANVYGPGSKSSSAGRGVLNMMVKKALQGEDLTFYRKGDFIRDYIFVIDVANAFLLAGKNIDILNGNHFVIGSGQGITIREAFELVAERVAVHTGRKVRVVSVEPPSTYSEIENRNFIADSCAFKNATGWEIKYSLEEGIDRTIEFFKNSIID